MLDLRRLRLLHELHRRGTVSAVAEALSYSPSTVSQQLGVLQREAGTTLFEPAGRRLRLTDAALVLVAHAEELLAGAERAEADLAAAAAGAVAGVVRVGSFQTASLHLLPARHGRARGRLPRRPGAAGRGRARAGARGAPLARARPRASPTSGRAPRARALPGLDREDLFAEPVLIALPASHPAAAARRPGARSPSWPARRGRPATPAAAWPTSCAGCATATAGSSRTSATTRTS